MGASECGTSVRFSVCEDGKRQVCEGAVLPVLSRLLGDEDTEVRVNAAGVIMYAVVITPGSNTQRSRFRRSVKWTRKKRSGGGQKFRGTHPVPAPAGKQQCLDLQLVPVLLDLVSQRNPKEQEKPRRRRVLIVYCLQALASLAEAPDGRRVLLENLPLLVEKSQVEDQDIRQAAQTAIKVVTWTP